MHQHDLSAKTDTHAYVSKGKKLQLKTSTFYQLVSKQTLQ